MIRAFRTGKENEDAMDEFMSLMLSLNVAPSLYSYLYVEDDFQ
jgi:hypothetical protein